jgi:hypothetical protein
MPRECPAAVPLEEVARECTDDPIISAQTLKPCAGTPRWNPTASKLYTADAGLGDDDASITTFTFKTIETMAVSRSVHQPPGGHHPTLEVG